MALKKAAFEQTTSPEYTGSENPPGVNPDENAGEKAANSLPEKGQPPEAQVSSLTQVIDNLSKVIETLSERQEPERSPIKRFITHPLTNSFLVVLFTGLVGGALTYYYTSLQKEVDYQRSLQQLNLTSQRSFSDELNKLRIQKIGEVWEQIDKNEVSIDRLWEKAYKASDSDSQNVNAINAFIDEDELVIGKNRFWLGEQFYDKIQLYLDKNSQLVLNMMLARPGTNLSEIMEERKKTKQDILKIKEEMILEGKTKNPTAVN